MVVYRCVKFTGCEVNETEKAEKARHQNTQCKNGPLFLLRYSSINTSSYN